MKNILKVLLLVLLTNTTINGFGQIKPLSIGDEFPDFTVPEVANYKTTSVKISDFKGKLLILDFWATWCSPCVALLPKIDSLEKQFADQIVILPVTYQDRKTVEAFLQKLSQNKHVKIASVVNDKIFNNLFPHGSIPFDVWIDKNGKVIATTEGGELNKKNIQSAVDGESSQIKNITGVERRVINMEKPIFINAIPFEATDGSEVKTEAVEYDQLLYQSILNKYIPNVASKLYFDSTHFVTTNVPILNFYRLYFGMIYNKSPYLFWSKSRCIIDTKDSTFYNRINSTLHGYAYEKWLKSNGYTYELIWKSAKTWKEKYELLADDLNRYFGKPLKISANLENRLVESDVLIRNSKGNDLTTVGGKAYEKHDAFSYVQHNLPLSHFIAMLEGYFWQNSSRPIIDETTIKGNVDLILNCNLNDINQVNKELTKYGLKFVN
jgi:thiol-disulfide isomerase/thioredoxin